MDDVDDGLGSEVNTPRDGDLSGQTNAPLDTSVGHLCMSLFIVLNFNTYKLCSVISIKQLIKEHRMKEFFFFFWIWHDA